MVSASRERWPQWHFTSEYLPLDHAEVSWLCTLPFAEPALNCLKVYLHKWVQTTICSPCLSSPQTSCSLKATESFNVLLSLEWLTLHLKRLVLVGGRVCFHLAVRDEVLEECNSCFKIYWCCRNFLSLRENLSLIYRDHIAKGTGSLHPRLPCCSFRVHSYPEPQGSKCT